MAELGDKFGKTYALVAEERVGGNTLTIAPPFTLDFTLDRKNFSFVQNATFRIYNLSKDKRNRIRFDQYDVMAGVLRTVEFYAGFDVPEKLFVGAITQAWSERQGVDMVTQIEADSGRGSRANAQIKTTTTFNKGVSLRDAVLGLIGEIPDVTIGVVTQDFTDDNGDDIILTKPYSFTGNAIDVIRGLLRSVDTDIGFWIDNGELFILKKEEVLAGEGVKEISSKTGLIGTPRREDLTVLVEMIFSPEFKLGHPAKLISTTGDENMTGNYVIYGVRHSARISPTVSGESRTVLTLRQLDTFSFVPGDAVI